jgi:hypothetical protein
MNERMPWGKYKGWLLSECPTSYLFWVYREADAAKFWLKSAISDELNRRAGEEAAEESFAAPAELRGIVKTWFAGLARDYHPDRTHDDGKVMAALNEAHERLCLFSGDSMTPNWHKDSQDSQDSQLW